MPREGVPYGGAICRLRERIAEIFDKLDEKLHSINGVEGDGQGNVVLRSDNAALTVTDDQLQHEIVLDLDTSQLPAADVNSVNGQVGVVALTADDIPSDNGDVQTDLDNLAGADVTLQGNINAEALARQNADSTLQTNINSANAAISGKVSKLTTAGDYAYTHSGSTDGEIALVDGITASTIPIRDANGRVQAADPASGATDKTLVTANWISQTGNSAPNNAMHRSGNEDFSGIKKASGGGFIRKKSAMLNLTIPPAGTITDENYVMEDVNGTTAVQIFNSYTENAQTIFQIASKYVFTDSDNVVKNTNGMLWIAVYKDKVTLYLRFVDKTGTAHLQAIATVTE